MITLVIVPMVAAAPDKTNHDGADKDNPHHDDRDNNENCPADNGNGHACGAWEHNGKCYHPVSIKNATLAATDFVSTISATSADFASWNGATVVKDTTYYDMTGTNASYSYDVMVNGQYAGYVIVSATRNNYPILEFSTGVAPNKDAATLLRAKQLAQSQIKNSRQVLGEAQPVYLGATFFGMVYPVQMNRTRMRPQQISNDWILVDLTQNRVVDLNNQRNVGNYSLRLNRTELKQQEEFQQQKIKDANAEWDSVENRAGSGTMKAAALVSVAASGSGGRAWLDVPAYLWKWGCTPTSSAMVLGYLRGKGLTQLPDGDAHGDPLNHELADQMNTVYNKTTGFCDPSADNKYVCGMTVPAMTDVGITNELQAHGISHWAGISNLDYSFAMDTAEIDKGYPYVLSMAYQQIYYLHSVAVIGYDSSGYLIIHDTWDTGSHYIHYGDWAGAQDTHVYPLFTHTVTASAGAHGSVSPAGSVSVPDMLSATVAITPDTGYVVDEIRDNGELETGNPYTIDHVISDHTITVTFKPIAGSSTGWNWATDGWGDWQHSYTIAGSQVGPNSEYGPVMVGDHGEHGTNTNLLAGSTSSSVWKTFTDPSGTGWNTVEFNGVMTASDVPNGRWMTMDINGQQVFGATAVSNPPGNGVPFTVKTTFPQSSTVTVKISNGQNPAWGPRFAMSYYSLKLSKENTLMAMSKSAETPFVIPDGSEFAGNVTGK
jgi:hypothetical protein